MGKIVANGKEMRLDLLGSLEEFLTSQGLSPRAVVVELNGTAVAPSEYGLTTLREGDKLEIVRVVAGG